MARVYFRRRKGETSTRKEAPKYGTWHLDYRDARGDRVQPKTTARTRAEAEEALREALQDAADIRNDRKREPTKPLLMREAAAGFLASRKGAHSIWAREIAVRLHVVPLLGEKLLASITTADIEGFARDLQAGHHGRKPLSAQTARQHVTLVSMIFKWAKKARLWSGDAPTADAVRPKLPRRMAKVIPLDKVAHFLSLAGEWHDLFWFSLATGLREGEVVALRWEDLALDGEEPFVHVRRSHGRDIPKGGEERTVPLQHDVAEMLRRRKVGASSRLVWPGKDGQMEADASQTYNRAFRRIAMKAGICKGIAYACDCGAVRYSPGRSHLRCHTCGAKLTKGVATPTDVTFRHFRSTYGTALGNPAIAQRALGHSDMRVTTGHYIAVSGADVRAAANNLPFVGQARRRDADVTQPDRAMSNRLGAWEVSF